MIHFRPTHGIQKEARCLGASVRTQMEERGNEPRGTWLEQPLFLLLLHQRRLSLYSRLHHCNMSPSGQCSLCSEEETYLNLFITST